MRETDTLRVEANAAGYLYIINQGSSGTWKPMFPSAEIEDGNNRIEGWRPYTMPPKSRLDVRQHGGDGEPVHRFLAAAGADLEGMIYSLQGKKKSGAPAAVGWERAARAIVQGTDHGGKYLQ